MSNHPHIEEITVNPVEDLPSMFGLNALKEINKSIRDRWNRCDCCGKFVAYNEVSRTLLTPDAEGTRETYETLCKKCK